MRLVFIKKIKFIYFFLKGYFFYSPKRFKTRKQLEEYQLKKFKNFSNLILTKSNFYHNTVKKFLNKNHHQLGYLLNYFPILEKKEFLENFDNINTCGINFVNAMELATKSEQNRKFNANINNIDIGLSTGTSGKRGLFLVSDKEKALWAGFMFSRSLHVNFLKSQRIALVLRANNNLYESLGNGHIKFKYFDLLQPLKDIYQSLQKYMPTVIVGPPSCLELIAEYELNKPEHLRMKPKQVLSAAETLTFEVMDKLKDAWKVPIQQIYQATEGFLAYTCTHGSLHMNEDLMIVEKEYIDKEKEIFIPIITDITRESQPIIRYKLTDVLVSSQEPCPCGSVLLRLDHIEGRCDDVLWFSGKPIFPDFLTRLILKSHSSIVDFRVIQEFSDSFSIALRLDEQSIHNACELRDDFYNSVHACVQKVICEFFTTQDIVMPKYHTHAFMLENLAVKRRRIKNQVLQDKFICTDV